MARKFSIRSSAQLTYSTAVGSQCEKLSVKCPVVEGKRVGRGRPIHNAPIVPVIEVDVVLLCRKVETGSAFAPLNRSFQSIRPLGAPHREVSGSGRGFLAGSAGTDLGFLAALHYSFITTARGIGSDSETRQWTMILHIRESSVRDIDAKAALNADRACRLTRHSLFVVATIALTGCSDELDVDLAACKAKGTGDMSEEEPATYLRECMRAEGWPLRDACLDKRDMWDSPDCYLR